MTTAVSSSGVELELHTVGSPTDRAMLLVMTVTQQATQVPPVPYTLSDLAGAAAMAAAS